MTENTRLQELEDREAIRQVFTDYARYLDSGEYAAYAGLFAREGVFGEAVGPAAIEARMKEYGKQVEEARSQGIFNDAVHVMGNHNIRIDGDTATAEVVWSYLTIDADKVPTVFQMGRYLDDLVRENGTWKIAHHRIERTMGRAQMEAPQPSRLDGVAQRLQEMEDREAIKRHCIETSNCLDARDLVGYGNAFTEDGEWSGIVGKATGPAAITELLSQYCKPWEREGQRTHHVTMDVIIDLHGDTATATSKWEHIVRGEKDEPVILHLGHYKDKLRRTPEGWRFTQRAAYADIPYIKSRFN